MSFMSPLTGSPPTVKGAVSRRSQVGTPAFRTLELNPTQMCQHLVIPVVLTVG